MSQPAVSVVIPVYNSEQYLKECMESLINQTLTDIEMIFVDDGSTDRSLEILRAYETADSRIRVLTQHNQYAGVARNNGMDHASGKYIIFLDSDDFFDLNMLEDMYSEAEKTQAEIVVCGYRVLNHETEQITETVLPNRTGNYSARDLGKDIFLSLLEVPWNKLILRAFVVSSNLRYQNLKNGNDMFFNKMITVLSNNIDFINKEYITYRYNNVNSLQGSKSNFSPCFGEALKAIKDEMESRNIYSGPYKDGFCQWSADVLEHRFNQAKNNETRQVLFKYCKQIAEYIFIDEVSVKFAPKDSTVYLFMHSDDLTDYLYQKNIVLNNQCKVIQDRCDVLKKQISRIKKSTTYRIGEILLFIPLKIKNLFEKLFKKGSSAGVEIYGDHQRNSPSL